MNDKCFLPKKGNNNMPKPKLIPKIFAIYLGGKHPRANIELHDLVITTGNSIQDCFQFCLDNWFVNKPLLSENYSCRDLFESPNLETKPPKIKPHIDGYFQIDLPSDYVIGGEYSLYAMNYGGYLPNQLAEMHEFVMVFAKDKGDAIKRSKKLLKFQFDLLHMDNCLEVDDIINLSESTGHRFSSHNPKGVIITLHQEYYSI
jgi:hypothetical protein